MKSFAPLILLALASLAVIRADTMSTDSLPDDDDTTQCKTCSAPDCTFDMYSDNRMDVKHIKAPKNSGQYFEEFQTTPKGKDYRPDIYANFFYIGDHKSGPPSGTITNLMDEEVALKIDLVRDGYPKPEPNTTMVVLVEADGSCTTSMPEGYVPVNVKKITAGTMPDKK